MVCVSLSAAGYQKRSELPTKNGHPNQLGIMKKNKITFRGLLLPNEEVTSIVEVRRNLLFFDKIDLVSPFTSAVLLNNEVSEELHDIYNPQKIATIEWASRGIFPRSETYNEEFKVLENELTPLKSKDIIRIVGERPFSQPQALLSLVTYASALSNENIVRSSVFDYKENSEIPYPIPNQLLTPLVNFSISGMEDSKILNEIEVKPRYDLSGIDHNWSSWGDLRIARIIRSLHLCEMHNSFPISTDISNATIIDSIIQETGLYHPTQEELADYALSLELFDNNKMNEFLESIDSRDFIKIRKKFRPHICNIRDDICTQQSLFSQVNETNLETYIKRLRKVKSSYNSNLDAWNEALHKLRLGALIKTGETIGGAVIGGVALTTLPAPLPAVVAAVLGWGLVSFGKLKTELQTVSIAYEKMTKSKLHIFKQLM